MPEVGRGAAHVVDIALEGRVTGQGLRLLHQGAFAPGGDHPPLVEGQGAEAAAAEASPAGGQGEGHLRKGRDGLLVHGMGLAGEGQVVDLVQFLPGEGRRRRIADQIPLLVGLDEGLAPDGVLLPGLGHEGLGVLLLIGGNLLIGGQGHVVVEAVQSGGMIAAAGDVPDVPNGRARVQRLRQGHDGPFPHAVQQQVGPRVVEDGVADPVVPVVVVGEAPKARFDAPDDHRHPGIGLPTAVGVDDGGSVGALARLAALGVGVLGPGTLSGGVVVHHGVDVAGGH